MLPTVYRGVWPDFLKVTTVYRSECMVQTSFARCVQYMREGQIHISWGGGGLHQLQKSTHIQGNGVTQN